jgi:ankyrin repeat protein
MLAMRGGHDDIASLLLEKSADPLLQDQFKKNAAMVAIEYGHSNMIALATILDSYRERDFALTDFWGHNLMTYAVVEGDVKCVSTLLWRDSDGLSLNAIVDDGAQHDGKHLDLLALACKRGHGQVVENLLTSPHRAELLALSKGNAQIGARPPTVLEAEIQRERCMHARGNKTHANDVFARPAYA